MQSSTESPFKRDEPVGRSAKWLWLAAVSASVWAASTVYSMVVDFGLTMDTLWRIITVALQVSLVLLLFRAARACSRCRQHRSFDYMAAAVRYQRPFWALLTVAAAIGSFTLVVTSLSARDRNKFVQRWIDEHPAPPANPSPP